MIDYGKIPPQNIQAEEMVIGSCLVDTDIAIEIVSSITPQMFYKQANLHLFDAIANCLRMTNYCDMVVVTDYLRKKGLLEAIGGPVYIAQISASIVSTGSAINMALIVKEKYLLREYIRISHELSGKAYAEDLAEVSEYAESEIYKLSDVTQSRDFTHLSEAIDEKLVQVGKIMRKEMSVVGIPSGYTKIDRVTSGWQAGDLVIIAARPSMGKTAVALELLRCAAELGRAGGFFSLEMSKIQIGGRYLSGASGYTNNELSNGEVKDYDKLVVSSNSVASLPIYIDDTPAITLFELRSKAKKMKLRHGIDIVVVDYLQLMKATAGSREQEVSQISRGLKQLAKELDVAVIALSQLNREVESRADKRPRLSDLRESGAIEQDADMVAFLFRPAYYEMKSIVIGDRHHDSDRLILFDIAKNRNGACGMVPLYHNTPLTRISEEREDEFTDEPVPFD